MNGKTAKLIRQVARTLHFNKGKGNTGDVVKYTKQGDTIRLADNHRLTAKVLTKLYKSGKFSTDDLRKELGTT